ncbi:helix-turn-helix transcriptional regulator [Mesorhizobium sp. B2-2-4]|uniref:ArsR/SmtB family transcription factor n=1 Tax=unclassified Mesorhizobium TaxID=325217 RepID=UPI0011293C13|nr:MULTISPECIES: metalloregulator ArsR/SmtB family transcription factor [unclassified Mesorhizobium]TPJ49925.1 helix-turn-helix transcriptional regulator [Mesorhizobium sp. B2-6-6]MBZ9893312.1 helix-turn-helix domain-containing protein [Mesorhizobium sp. BR1-1-6]MBZ9920335.1 helix-turn-helix domain-containing protein [Mesorhizobium sp. BR1-1-7]MBZ9952748.1 helix-turn-helix domain-containing protein [Mesorhizobium sp. BR1-1-15]MBZ9968572.1 helix-turn-helix domain-containing protein [Mesorhizobi
MDAVFRALADPTRRQLLDSLHDRNGQTLNGLCAEMDMTRQAVTKHLAILEEANLVTTIRKGREKEHYLNPVPINEIAERWIGKFERGRLSALGDLKRRLEKED